MTLPFLAPSSAARSSRSSSPCASASARVAQKHPGQGDVLKLSQVAEVVLRGQALRTRPAEGLHRAFRA